MNENKAQDEFITDNIKPETEAEDGICFVFHDNKIYSIKKSGEMIFPTLGELNRKGLQFANIHYLGTLHGKQSYGIELLKEEQFGYELMPFRALLMELEQNVFLMAGRAYQIVNWGILNRFCGKCGGQTEFKENERVIICPKCKASFYPRISPAIIVAILRGDQILLAHNNNFTNNLYSLVAGFVEPGETFEACVKREVMEEVGIKIKNIRYYGSQPWPFPDSLMIGFIAEYDSGEIKADGVEISDAGWYTRVAMPEIPLSHSIAGKIIRAYIENKLIANSTPIDEN